MSFINYFFEVVVPQLLEYFKDNAKDVPYILLSKALLNNKSYENYFKRDYLKELEEYKWELEIRKNNLKVRTR